METEVIFTTKKLARSCLNPDPSPVKPLQPSHFYSTSLTLHCNAEGLGVARAGMWLEPPEQRE